MKFETLNGVQDVCQRNFTQSSKIRKATTFLKGNALQWCTTMLMQNQAPTTYVGFKQIYIVAH